MAEYKDRERFIPFRKSEIVELVCEEGSLSPDDQQTFRSFCKLLESIYHFEFHKKLEELKDSYAPLNPDRDTVTTREYSPEDTHIHEDKLLERFGEILNDANYEQLGEDDLAYAMEHESLFKISLFVDFDDFDRQLIFWRGVKEERLTLKKWLVKKIETAFPVYDRVALLIKFKDAEYFEAKKRKDLKFEPGSMIIKLFKNIPKADMEMLFPNTQVRMKLKDKLLISGGVLGGGVAVFLKASAGLIAMTSVLWFLTRSFVMTGGELPKLGSGEISAMVAGGSALAAIAAFAMKQWNGYKNRKIQFMKALGDNLYFKNLDNNAGVFHHITDAAEEEECKEAMLAYYFLIRAEKGLSTLALNDEIEKWFETGHGIQIDFEIKDALRKLKELDLCKIVGQTPDGSDIWDTPKLDDALKQLDYVWDNYFQYNQ